MKSKNLGNKIKELRKIKGLSQEELAFKTGLSLRTIQRIENGESEPRGDSLKRISTELDFNANDIYDWGLIEDKTVLKTLNLSCLSILIFPLMGILVPLIIWISNKNRIKGANQLGKLILNYQITWCMTYFILLSLFALTLFFSTINDWLTLKELTTIYWFSPVIIMFIMYSHAIRIIYLNNRRLNKDISVRYKPRIRFIK